MNIWVWHSLTLCTYVYQREINGTSEYTPPHSSSTGSKFSCTAIDLSALRPLQAFDPITIITRKSRKKVQKKPTDSLMNRKRWDIKNGNVNIPWLTKAIWNTFSSIFLLTWQVILYLCQHISDRKWALGGWKCPYCLWGRNESVDNSGKSCHPWWESPAFLFHSVLALWVALDSVKHYNSGSILLSLSLPLSPFSALVLPAVIITICIRM